MEKWIFLFLGLVLAYLLEFTRPWAKSYIDKSVFSSRKKRAESLLDEYRRVKSYKQNYALLTVSAIRNLAYGLIITSVSIGSLVSISLSEPIKTTGGISISELFNYVFLFALVFSSLMIYQRVIIPIRNTIHFSAYTIKLTNKILKLGGNPEDLDKEEN